MAAEQDAYGDHIKPEEPSESDCCHSGCSYCVFDLYQTQLSKWKLGTNINEKIKHSRLDLLSETKFKPFILLEKTEHTSDAYSLRFQPKKTEDKNQDAHKSSLEQTIPGVLPYHPGQHLVMKNISKILKENEFDSTHLNESSVSSSQALQDSENERVTDDQNSSSISKAYTPFTLASAEINCCFNIIFKLYADGEMSKYIKSLTVGDISYFRGPYGNFNYMAKSYKIILMLCIGTGIAPIYAVIQHILRDESDETIMKLLYGSRKVHDIILRDELRRCASFWNFSSKYFITRKLETTDDSSIKFGESFTYKRLEESDVQKEFDNIKNLNDCLVLICGTDEFSGAMRNFVSRSGISSSNIHIF